MSEETFVGKRFVIVIPKKIRKKLGIKEGQRVLISTDGWRIIIEPLFKDPFKILAEIIGESYDEKIDEVRAEKWLMKDEDH